MGKKQVGRCPINRGGGNQSLWEFWSSSWPKKVVGILLGLAIGTIISYQIFMKDEMQETYLVSAEYFES
jgi:hypothetical protein